MSSPSTSKLRLNFILMIICGSGFLIIACLLTLMFLGPQIAQITDKLTTPQSYPTKPIMTSSLDKFSVSSANCQLPCWHELTPGASNIEHFTTISQTLLSNQYGFEFMRADKDAIIYSNEVPRQAYYYDSYKWHDPQNDQYFYHDFKGSHLLRTTFIIKTANVDMLFEQFGTPSHYIAFHFHDIDWSGVVYRLFYLEQGVYVDLIGDNGNPEKCETNLDMDRRVDSITLAKSTENIHEFISSIAISVPQGEIHTVLDWQSFDNIHIANCTHHQTP